MTNTIIKNRNFMLLWLGHLISHAGDAIYMIALPWLMLELTGSKSLTSFVATSAYLPAVFFGLIAGVVVDRYDRKSKASAYSILDNFKSVYFNAYCYVNPVEGHQSWSSFIGFFDYLYFTDYCVFINSHI